MSPLELLARLAALVPSRDTRASQNAREPDGVTLSSPDFNAANSPGFMRFVD